MSSSQGNKRVFGQATRRSKGSRYQRQAGNNNYNRHSSTALTEEQELAIKRQEYKQKRKAEDEAMDARFGYERFMRNGTSGDDDGKKKKSSNKTRRGWIFNMLPTTVSTNGSTSTTPDSTSTNPERSGLDLYFIDVDGSTFKATVLHEPYFYVIANPPASYKSRASGPAYTNEDNEEVDEDSMFYETLISTLLRKYEANGLNSVLKVPKIDLDALNHLGEAGSRGRIMLKLSFNTVQQLMDVRKSIMTMVKKNAQVEKEANQFQIFNPTEQYEEQVDPLTTMVDIREYDVPYLIRVCIDLEIRGGAWYTVTPNLHDCGVTLSNQDVVTKANPKFLAFDIECTKAPLKFPDANVDSIFMISYMVEGQGYLILSRDIVGDDVADFEYTPKPGYPGPFKIFNELTEEDLIRRFLSEYQRIRPQIVVTYNGDFFDWPFLEQRAAVYGLDLRHELGVERVGGSDDSVNDGEYRGRTSVHMDAFSWVQRDSYLPQGSQGLKAVTKYKLGYDPVEVDPEDMVRYAREKPVHMASYSVSDAVATYYLYEKYVHMFIFSLCTIIPMGPEDVLRKGSGTLCETLLIVQACEKNIICPNKQVDPLAKFHEGHLVESETYIGGKVECLETGVYRSDIEYKFDLKPSAFQQLIDNVDRDMTFAIEVEGGLDRNKVTNYDEVRCSIIEKLELLRDRPVRTEKPYVYHLDVGAMYPNIILTNRLQPSAIVDDATCAACDFNQAKNNCKRKMEWIWRGDYNPATKGEYHRTKDQLTREKFEEGKSFHEMTEKEQATLVSSRLKKYSNIAYKKTKVTKEITRTDTVCMRENDFYVDTVRQFRDRRYEYKKLTKTWGGKVKSAKDALSKKDAEDRALVYDSLQVAHKCILNSFYGYVMRKGARWRSMEMAGIVTKNGADLITQARILVEQIGRPLELDTDGIWCILPQSFPDIFNFKFQDGSKFRLEYPCVMLNADVHDNFTNHQYQTLVDPEKRKYETRSECSIFFEVDGPYRCMVIPSSTEEGKLLKKRYAVFNFDGSLAELKGFELKRRGELELIKTFQSQVFERFLNGNSLEDCYNSVAEIANHWIDILDTQGESLETEELVDLISENRSMSRQLEDYGAQKGTSQTTARRLGEFLGAEIIKDKGLNCKFVIAERPHGAPVTERAIPTAIWKAEPAVMKFHLRKWLKSPGMDEEDFDIRNILDWEYYRDRLGKTIQKIITIPAALQKVSNPVPRIPHPEWLQKTVRRLNDRYKQRSITSMFTAAKSTKGTNGNNVVTPEIRDIEDITGGSQRTGRPVVHITKRRTSNSGLTKATPRNENMEVDIVIEDSTNIPNPEVLPKVALSADTFHEWLSQKKSSWKFRERRKRLHRDSAKSGNKENTTEGINNDPKKRARGSMEGYIRDAAVSLATHEWHIIEIREISPSEEEDSVSSSSGEFIMWVMLGNNSLQRIKVMVPRMLYIDCKDVIKEISTENITTRRIEKYLPQNKTPKYLYEVTLSEDDFHRKNWLDKVCSSKELDLIDSFYELKTPLILRSVTHIGSMCRVNSSAVEKSRNYTLSDLKRIDHPSEGDYLHDDLSYKRIFLYERFHHKNQSGILALFFMDDDGGSNDEKTNLSTNSHVWLIKPGGNRGQKNVSKKTCETIFTQLLQHIQEISEQSDSSDYAHLSAATHNNVKTVEFVDSESQAFSRGHEVLNGYSRDNKGSTFLLTNSTKPAVQLRNGIPSCNSFPVVVLPSPPGIAHNPSASALPSLNWEPEAVQLCFEAYLYMGSVSFPKAVSCARFGKVPIGNLGTDALTTTYDVMLSRQLQKNRALSWASVTYGCPDVGYSSMPLITGSTLDTFGASMAGNLSTTNDIWGDEDEGISPVICNPGVYRSICVEIDVHDLAVAALLSDLGAMSVGSVGGNGNQLDNEAFSSSGNTSMISSSGAPLGDEMCTAISLPILRSLIHTCLRHASDSNSIANQMLDNIHRLVSNPDAMLNDPALHRVLLTLMKSSFQQLLREFQRLGSTIICATFNRILISTNKSSLSEAREYIDFVISTIQKRALSTAESGKSFERLSLSPHEFYSDYLFLDEHNFGGILFENREALDDDEAQWAFPLQLPGEEDKTVSVVPTIISGWNIQHYLASEIAQEYFRIVIGRFSKEVYRKRLQLQQKASEREKSLLVPSGSKEESVKKRHQPAGVELTSFKKNMVSRQFSSYLTRAVAEITKDGGGPESFPYLPGSHLKLRSPVLEFVKSVLTVLELDPDVDHEIQVMKKSLFSQIGVQEYSDQVKWRNPCASFILPDVYCSECRESRDIDLCVLPPPDEDQVATWTCDDCQTAYDAECIEQRLVDIVEKKCIRYQLQDLRCMKTNRAATRTLGHQSENSGKWKADITREEFASQLQILQNLARFYNLEWLLETTDRLLKAYN